MKRGRPLDFPSLRILTSLPAARSTRTRSRGTLIRSIQTELVKLKSNSFEELVKLEVETCRLAQLQVNEYLTLTVFCCRSLLSCFLPLICFDHLEAYSERVVSPSDKLMHGAPVAPRSNLKLLKVKFISRSRDYRVLLPLPFVQFPPPHLFWPPRGMSWESGAAQRQTHAGSSRSPTEQRETSQSKIHFKSS